MFLLSNCWWFQFPHVLFFAFWKRNALGWCWFVEGAACYFSHCRSAVSFWKQHNPFISFVPIVYILLLSLRSLWRIERSFGCCRSKLMCKSLPLIFLKILLQNCCFSCHFFFCPPLAQGILFVMSLQLFFEGGRRKKNQFVDIFSVLLSNSGNACMQLMISCVHRMEGPGN